MHISQRKLHKSRIGTTKQIRNENLIKPRPNLSAQLDAAILKAIEMRPEYGKASEFSVCKQDFQLIDTAPSLKWQRKLHDCWNGFQLKDSRGSL